MADNRGVAYIEPGKVEVQTSTTRSSSCKDGPGVHPDNVGRKTPHGAILQDRLDQHLRLGPAHGPRPHDGARGPDPRPRDHRRGDRGRARRRVHQEGRPVSVPFNIACGRCRMCKEGNTGVCLNVNPDRPRLGLRLRRHGRLGRRPGRVRDGPLRRLEPAQVPRQGAGDGEDPRPDDALATSSRPATTAASRAGVDPGRRSTSPARARSGSPPPTRRSCWARRW